MTLMSDNFTVGNDVTIRATAWDVVFTYRISGRRLIHATVLLTTAFAFAVVSKVPVERHNMAKKLRSEPRVFSYLRFSRPEQALGDSLRRQQATSFDLAKQIAKDRGMQFDESLSAGDRGLSAYTGAHRRKGVLGVFLDAVKRGDVPRGSVLVVEDLDRLSRLEPVDAIDMIISGIIGKGISIVAGGFEYDAKSLQGGLIHQLIGKLQNAHEESRKKSERLSAAWNQKRALARAVGKPMTHTAPAWIELVEGKYVLIPEAAKTIRNIFQWKLKGMGAGAIVGKLNLSGAWQATVSDKRKTTGWRPSYVKKILRERSVIGEYQPHHRVNGKRVKDGDPIENFYPAVIKPDLFHAVQKLLDSNRHTGGRAGKVSNLFTGLAVCGYCGGPMHFINKGGDGADWRYLTCYNAARKVKCTPSSMRYAEVEALLLDNCPRLKPDQVLPNPTEKAELVEELSLKVDGLSAKRDDIERKIGNLVDQLADTSDKTLRQRYEVRILELEQTKAITHQELKEAESELQAASVDARSFREWKKGMDDLRAALGKGGPEIRAATRQHFRQFVSRIECYSRGHAQLWDRGARDGEDIVEYAEAAVDDIRMPKALRAEFGEFVTDLTRRRMSKDGRFVRVHFTTGAVVDLVPPGSLASGVDYGEGIEPGDAKTWKFVVPDLQVLLDDFRSPGRKKI